MPMSRRRNILLGVFFSCRSVIVGEWMTVKEKRGIGRAQSILHNDYAYVADVQVDLVIEVIGTAGSSRWRGRGSRERKHLVIAVLIERLYVWKKQVPGVNVLLDGVKGQHRAWSITWRGAIVV
jgi:hypothetical protein